MTSAPWRPLDPAELFFWWVDQVSPIQLTMVVELAASVSSTALEAALARAMARHPMLGVRFAAGREVGFVPADSGAAVRVAAAGLSAEALAEEELAQRFAGSGPLVRATHSVGVDGTTLALVLHHAIADGRSALSVLSELVDDVLGLPSPAIDRYPSPPPLHSRLPARWPHDARAVRALSSRLAGERLAGVPAPAAQRHAGGASGPARVIAAGIEAMLVTALRERCRRERTTVHAALAAALLLAGSELPLGHGETLALATPVDLRPTLEPPLPPHTPSLATGTVTTFHRVAAETSAWSLAREIGAAVAARVAAGEAHLAYLVERLDRLPPTPEALPALARGLAARPAASVMSNLGVLPGFGADRAHRLLCALRPLPQQPCFVVATTREDRLELTLVHDAARLAAPAGRALVGRLLAGLAAAVG